MADARQLYKAGLISDRAMDKIHHEGADLQSRVLNPMRGSVGPNAPAVPMAPLPGSAGFARPAYHGSPTPDLQTLKPGERGPFGPATYLSPSPSVAERYAGPGGSTYEAKPPGEIFHGLGSSWAEPGENPYETWRQQSSRLVDAAPAQHQDAIAKLAGTHYPNEGYEFFNNVARQLGSKGAAQGLFKDAGFSGISGHVDGPEIAIFGDVTPQR